MREEERRLQQVCYKKRIGFVFVSSETLWEVKAGKNICYYDDEDGRVYIYKLQSEFDTAEKAIKYISYKEVG